jgi:hypothetical protein
MNEREEIELTSEVQAFVGGVAAKLVRRHCPKFVDPRDVAQAAKLQLLRKPPKHDPSRGAKEALIDTIVERAVEKCAAWPRQSLLLFGRCTRNWRRTCNTSVVMSYGPTR